MAQVKPFDYYEQDMAPAFAGMKANTTVDVVDSYPAASGIDAGVAVVRGTDPATVQAVSTAGDGAKVIGIAVHVHKEPNATLYAEGDSVSVMSFGDIYVEAGSDVTAGDSVALTIADGAGSFVASATTGAEAVAGMMFMDSGSEGDIVRVRIRK